MSDILLTKDADKVISAIYKEYNARIKNNISKSKAICFSKSTIHSIFPNQNISNELDELNKHNLISKNIIGTFDFTDLGIAYSENKFPKLVEKIIDTVSKFIP